MSNFSFYESHVASCIDDARELIDEMRADGGQRSAQLAQAKLDSAKSALEELRREIVLMPTNDRAAAKRSYDAIQQQVAQLDEELRSAAKRQQLLGGGYNLRRAASVDEQLMQTVDMQQESNEIGVGILTRLREQRDTLTRSADNVNLINSSVSGTGNILGKMEAVQRRNKMIMWGVVGLLVLAILIMFYLKIF